MWRLLATLVALSGLLTGCGSSSDSPKLGANGLLSPKPVARVWPLGAPGSGTREAADALMRVHLHPDLYPAVVVPALASLRCRTKPGYVFCLGRAKNGRRLLAKLVLRNGSLTIECVGVWRGAGPDVGCLGADSRNVAGG